MPWLVHQQPPRSPQHGNSPRPHQTPGATQRPKHGLPHRRDPRRHWPPRASRWPTATTWTVGKAAAFANQTCARHRQSSSKCDWSPQHSQHPSFASLRKPQFKLKAGKECRGLQLHFEELWSQNTLLRVIPTVTLFCHSFWILIWNYIWHVFSESLFWHPFWHSVLTFFLASLLARYSDILSDILSGILLETYSDTLSGIYSDILSDILSGIYFHFLSAILSSIF